MIIMYGFSYIVCLIVYIILVGGFNHLEKYDTEWLVDYPIYYGKI